MLVYFFPLTNFIIALQRALNKFETCFTAVLFIITHLFLYALPRVIFINNARCPHSSSKKTAITVLYTATCNEMELYILVTRGGIL